MSSALPNQVWGQPPRPVRRVGVLGAGPRENGALALRPLVDGMRELGYSEGRDFSFETKWANGTYERMPDLAAELVQSNPDVIVSLSATAVRSLQHATRTIPIVIGYASDPVGAA